VGRIVVIDFDRIDWTNLSRIVGASRTDALLRRRKVDVLGRLVRSIDPAVKFVGIRGDATYTNDARKLAHADFLFSASDTQFARFAFNALCHQYLIPGIQIGAKVVADKESGDIQLAYSMNRPVSLDGACLECSGSIDPDALHREQISDRERRDQDYVRDGTTQINDPSVITLNGISAALALLDFQFLATGMFSGETDLAHRIYHAPERELRQRTHVTKAGCRWCDHKALLSAYGCGDGNPLPLRRGSLPPERWLERLSLSIPSSVTAR
jgi:hypothetical protein